MGEATQDVVLKLSLQVENNRLDKIDTTNADRSLEELGKRIEKRLAEAGRLSAERIQASLDGISFRATLGNAGGGAVGGGGSSAGRRHSGNRGYDTFNDRGFGAANRDPDLKLAPINSSELIGRRAPDDTARIKAMDEAAKRAAISQANMSGEIEQTFMYMERSRGEVNRMIAAQEQLARAAEVDVSGNRRISESLGKVSNALALTVIGYRALTQVNGEHVNVLGEWESRIESGLIGVSLLTRGVSAGVSVLGKFGVAVTAGSAALAAVPLAVAIGGFKMLADAQAEATRQAQISAAWDERIAAGNEARRQRELARERIFVDAVVGLRQMMAAASQTRLERDLDTKNRQIGLVVDPEQRLRGFQGEEARLRGQQGQRQFELDKLNRNWFGGTPEQTSAFEEKRKSLVGEIEAIERRITSAVEGQRDAVSEMVRKHTEGLEGERQQAEHNEEERDRFGKLSRREQARRIATGDVPTSGGRSSASIDAEISRIQKEAERVDQQFVERLKQQADRENTLADALDEATASRDALSESLEKYLEKNKEINAKQQQAIDAHTKELAELGASKNRGNGKYGPTSI